MFLRSLDSFRDIAGFQCGNNSVMLFHIGFQIRDAPSMGMAGKLGSIAESFIGFGYQSIITYFDNGKMEVVIQNKEIYKLFKAFPGNQF